MVTITFPDSQPAAGRGLRKFFTQLLSCNEAHFLLRLLLFPSWCTCCYGIDEFSQYARTESR